jgi:hypothetical protein
MDISASIGRVRAPGGGQRKGVPKPPRKDGFAGGTITPQQALAARWSKDRRTVVAMAQEARPEAFDTVIAIMRDPKVEAPTRLRAGELVLAYSDGKPRQAVDISIGPREVHTLTREQLEAIAAGAPPPFALTHQGVTIEGEALEVEAPKQNGAACERGEGNVT